MKKIRVKVLKYVSLVCLAVNLSACQQELSSADVVLDIEASEKELTSYHVLLKQNEYNYEREKGANPDLETVANGQIILQEGGSGSRVDKVNGVAKDKTEVVANATTGMIRYHQNEWQPTLTPKSALGNIVTIPYEKTVLFVKELANLEGVKWESDVSYDMVSYVGDSADVVKSVYHLLGLQVVANSYLDMGISINKDTHFVEFLEIHMVQNDGVQHEKNIEVRYNGFNRQRLKELPKR
ncbi:hypothetical protein SAMN05421767_12734 [Granulicatella balaenopterae]|uniref:Lipoprotein n=1 Tax=Granulicatella balaenopterae TaxID=137733 RepID=A0A1H9MJL5_9LACT|nr:hypothetical protein [Granulicatella balaenopterae]SER23818.1 hypothetical protein SAMN05421767_12734 [Granulicatella balaenopterae]